MQALYSNFTPAQLSRGFSIDAPSYDKKHRTFSLSPKQISGSRLTVKKLSALADGRRAPSKSDIHLLRNLWRRYAYHSLRAAGAPPSQARRFDRSPIPVLSATIAKYNKATKALADVRETAQVAIQYTMGKSDVKPEGLRRRMLRSGLKDWRGIIEDNELEAIIDSFMVAGEFAEIDEDEEEY